MKFLIDNQLPAALAGWLLTKGADAVHVVELELDTATDRRVWDRAATESRIVISKDEDFFHLANRPDDHGRLLWIRIGNCRRTALFALLDTRWSAIEEAFASGQRIVELR